MPNSVTFSVLVETAHMWWEMISSSEALPLFVREAKKAARQLLKKPSAQRAGVEHRFRRGERFGDDHDERLLGIDVLDVAHHVKRVHVGDEQELTTLCSVMSNRVVAQRLIHEFGTQVTAANTDSNDGREGLSCGSLQ